MKDYKPKPVRRFLYRIFSQAGDDFMYQRKLERDIRCPLEYGLDIFGRKWNSRIICVLAAKKVLPCITPLQIQL